MSKKEKPDSNDEHAVAGSAAAYSLASFFKKKNWEVVSFFPNCSCSKEKNILQPDPKKEKDKEAKVKSKEKKK